SNCGGQRDPSWGVRSVHNPDAMRPPVANHRNFHWMWCMFQFEDFGVSVFLKERAPGKTIYLSGSEVSEQAGIKKERHVVRSSTTSPGRMIRSANPGNAQSSCSTSPMAERGNWRSKPSSLA